MVEISANGQHVSSTAPMRSASTDETDPARASLADFVARTGGRVTDWLYVDNPELGPEQPYHERHAS